MKLLNAHVCEVISVFTTVECVCYHRMFAHEGDPDIDEAVALSQGHVLGKSEGKCVFEYNCGVFIQQRCLFY